ncbi:RCC1 domain-containing protein 1 [Thelohanellus kitauei]|uniref:RCC1 domain-containing protein 1 n=1 Tax=Thelohanellus kitauei TaxID=669202 RepID=A0A0C2MIA5_THEKT|nr:RCC1 domain-containing protein 1 [Thelohanellus kitauei]
MGKLLLFGVLPMTKCYLDNDLNSQGRSDSKCSLSGIDFGSDFQMFIGDTFVLVYNNEEIYVSAGVHTRNTNYVLELYDTTNAKMKPLVMRRLNVSPRAKPYQVKISLDDRILVYGPHGIIIFDLNLDKWEVPTNKISQGAKDVWVIGTTVYYINLKGQLCCIDEEKIDDYICYDGKVIQNCTKLVGGYEHVCVLTTDGNLFTYGASTKGQGGLGYVEISTNTTHKLECFGIVKIKDVVSGGWHTLALSETNDLYAWGWNESYQIGIVSPSVVPDPKSINLREYQQKDHPDVVQISAGVRHSAALDVGGNVWTWGSNRFKQVTNSDSRKATPFLLWKKDANTLIDKIICGRWCTVIKTANI